MSWLIVCPDGKIRHITYSVRENAEYDASLFAERRCCTRYAPIDYRTADGHRVGARDFRLDPYLARKVTTGVERQGKCPEGAHRVIPEYAVEAASR